MNTMTKHPPTEAVPHDYLPAAGRDAFLPFYDLLSLVSGGARLHTNLVGQADLAAGQRVLEIGCGTGNLAIRAKRTAPGIELVGSDPDPLALDRARRKARRLIGISFEQVYAQRLPYPDASFDRVLSSLMLHHLDHDAKIATAAEVARVLRPGGSAHVVDFDGSLHGMHGALAGRMRKVGHVGDNEHDGLLRLFDGAGLKTERVGTSRHRLMGDAAYYRATRPA
jgi:ubiquinone/menaquinone biosynthesis C-methylase UbiE